jgi:hypothetical protein
MGMAELLSTKSRTVRLSLVVCSEGSVIGFTSFRCNITNYYFYFRLIAFVNLVILLRGNENADCGAGNPAPGTKSKAALEGGCMTHEKRRTALILAIRGAIVASFGLILVLTGCSKAPKLPEKLSFKTAKAKPEPSQPSTINVDVNGGGPAVLTTSAAQFVVRTDGYVEAFLLKDGKKLSLDDPNATLSAWREKMCISLSTSRERRCTKRLGRWAPESV